MATPKRKRKWQRGVLAALVIGAADAVRSAFGVIANTPDVYNFDAGLPVLLRFLVIQVIIGSVGGVALFLHEAPLPPSEDEVETKVESVSLVRDSEGTPVGAVRETTTTKTFSPSLSPTEPHAPADEPKP